MQETGVQEEGRSLQDLPGQHPFFFFQKSGVCWPHWIPEWSLSSVIVSDTEVGEP